MNEGRDRGLWWHTASIEATLANTVRDKKKRRRGYQAAEFHPWEERDRQRKRRAEAKMRREDGNGKSDVRILKAVFVDRKSFTEIETEFGV